MVEPETIIKYKSRKKRGIETSISGLDSMYKQPCKLELEHLYSNQDEWIRFCENHYAPCLGIPIDISIVGLNPSVELIIAEKIKRHYPDASVIELGCGTGVVSSLIAKGGYAKEVVAVEECHLLADNTRNTIREYGMESKVRVIESSIESLGDIGKYDVVLAFAVLEHVRNVNEILDIVVSLMKPGATFWGFVPNMQNCDCPTHLHYFDLISILYLLSIYFTDIVISKLDFSTNNLQLIFECKE